MLLWYLELITHPLCQVCETAMQLYDRRFLTSWNLPLLWEAKALIINGTLFDITCIYLSTGFYHTWVFLPLYIFIHLLGILDLI